MLHAPPPPRTRTHEAVVSLFLHLFLSSFFVLLSPPPVYTQAWRKHLDANADPRCVSVVTGNKSDMPAPTHEVAEDEGVKYAQHVRVYRLFKVYQTHAFFLHLSRCTSRRASCSCVADCLAATIGRCWTVWHIGREWNGVELDRVKWEAA